MTTKKCKSCQEEKDISEYSKHPHTKDRLATSCKECANRISREYRAKNLELCRERERVRNSTPERKEQSRQWEIANREKRRDQERARNAANREEYNAKQRARRDKNPEVFRAYALKWREKNREHLRAKASEYAPAYRALHPDKVVESTRRYRARVISNGGSYTPQEWQGLKAQYGDRCVCCGKHESESHISPDHVIPVSKGGTSDISNIQPLCRRCNAIKSDRCTDYRSK